MADVHASDGYLGTPGVRPAELLVKEGLLRPIGSGRFANTGMVIMAAEGKELFRLAAKFSQALGAIIRKHLPEVKLALATIPEFSAVPFSRVSFFILSNVLLDNWQIDTVELEHLKSERPLRASKRFYFSIMESETNSERPFGIYGNSVPAGGVSDLRFYGKAKAPTAGPANDCLALTETILVFSPGADRALGDIAGIIRPPLLSLLAKIDHELRAFHGESRWRYLEYSEFFIWWYHFLYTQVTNELAANRLLEIPESGFFAYAIR